MARVEILLAIGFLVGVPTGLLISWLWRKWLASRDSAIRQANVRVRLADASTDDLINEVSKRDDINEAGRRTR